MAKSIKIKSDSSIVDVESYLEYLQNTKPKEIELNDFIKLVEALGGKFVGNNGGSTVQFYHELLEGISYYCNGLFSLHTIHSGGNNKKILYQNFKKYQLQTIQFIIKQIKYESK